MRMLKVFAKARKSGDEKSDRHSGYLLAIKYLPRFIRLVVNAHRGYAAAMITLRFARALAPIAIFWVSKLIIDQVIAVRAGNEAGYGLLWRLFAIEFAIVLVNELLSRVSSLVESLLGDLVSIHTSKRLMEQAATLDLQRFEDPNFYDVLERARRNTSGQIGLIATLISMGQDALTLLSLASALLVYKPWLLLLLAVAVLPGFFSETRFAALGYSLLYRWTPQRRQLDYLRYLGTSNQTVKELHMFQLARWLIDRYANLSTRFFKANKSLAIRKGAASGLLAVVGAVGYYVAYAIILMSAATGEITLGMLTFLVASFMRGRDLITRLLAGATSLYEQCLYLKDLFDFFEIQPVITSPPNAIIVRRSIREGFVFENVSFRYPGSSRWAVRDVSFALRPGERLALVGENGAGKTTLTKLLARLYDPTQGRILLDGRDLREYELASLRKAIGVIFQDFVCYDLHLDENIGVGGIDDVAAYLNDANDIDGHSGEGPDLDTWPTPKVKQRMESQRNSSNGSSKDALSVPPSIVMAAQKSMVAELVPRFPRGYRQMLGRRFSGGVNLSGGEWQKIALARAYMRDAQVLILDEPTAALDARAEYETFNRFVEIMRGRMTLLISHRFSTVRMADRIVVLKDGAVVESGAHDELVTRDGLYAELFKLQAVGYR